MLETLVSLNGTPGHLAPQNDTDPARDVRRELAVLTRRAATATWTTTSTHHRRAATPPRSPSLARGSRSWARRTRDEGAFQVYVDGTLERVGLSEASTLARRAAGRSSPYWGSRKGAHTVKVVNDAHGGQSTLILDGFVVVPDAVAPIHDITFSGHHVRVRHLEPPARPSATSTTRPACSGTRRRRCRPRRASPAPCRFTADTNISFRGDTFSAPGRDRARPRGRDAEHDRHRARRSQTPRAAGSPSARSTTTSRPQTSLMTSGDTSPTMRSRTSASTTTTPSGSGRATRADADDRAQRHRAHPVLGNVARLGLGLGLAVRRCRRRRGSPALPLRDDLRRGQPDRLQLRPRRDGIPERRRPHLHERRAGRRATAPRPRRSRATSSPPATTRTTCSTRTRGAPTGTPTTT